jgi:hypothetical protein
MKFIGKLFDMVQFSSDIMMIIVRFLDLTQEKFKISSLKTTFN